MEYNQYDLEHLQSMRSGNIYQTNNPLTPEMYIYLSQERQKIELEIGRRLQLVLNFDEEPEDGAYCD